MKNRNFLIIVGLLFCTMACAYSSPGHPPKLVFTVQMDPVKDIGVLHVFIDWPAIVNRIGVLDKNKVAIIDLNNDKKIKAQVVDADKNNIPEGIAFATPFRAEEPVRTFELCEVTDRASDLVLASDGVPTENLKITFLKDAGAYVDMHGEPKKWSETVARSFLSLYPDPATLEIFSKGQWSYTNGFFLNALSLLYSRDKNQEYFGYLKKWADLFVTSAGTLDTLKYSRRVFELDNILPGRLLIFLYQHTQDERYRKAAYQLIDQLNHQPRTSEGGYWHKKVYTRMMWLDGIYMADVFLAQYAEAFSQPQYFDEAAKQILLIYKNTFDPKTGLLYHGWDETKNKVWANQETGTSPEFWGRALGWYMMALIDVLDYLPANHPNRGAIIKIFRDLSASLACFQDKSTGMWYQVVDKGQQTGNWLETSCSAMFAYAYAKGGQNKYLTGDYLEKARKTFEGLKNREVYFDDDGKFYLQGTVKVGTLNLKVSKGDFDYYIGVDRRINDFKGVAAFVYLAMALEEFNRD